MRVLIFETIYDGIYKPKPRSSGFCETFMYAPVSLISSVIALDQPALPGAHHLLRFSTGRVPEKMRGLIFETNYNGIN